MTSKSVPTDWHSAQGRSIGIDIAYYDEDHRRKLATYPTATAIQGLVESGISVPITEFLTYYYFHQRRPNRVGYRNFSELARHVQDAYGHLRHYVALGSQSIYVPPGVGAPGRDISEHIGESIGLSVINRIQNMDLADWTKIPELPGTDGQRTLDFELTTGYSASNIIQVECKGSCVEDNALKPPAVSQHKASIERKKKDIRQDEKKHQYPYPADLRYGAITVLDGRADGRARCWLLDPPANRGDGKPELLRILSRITFLRNWIALIMPRSTVATALSTRLDDLLALRDPAELDGRPLRNARGEMFGAPSSEWMIAGPRWAGGRSQVKDGTAFGSVDRASDKALFFVGIRDELMQVAVEQSFRAVQGMKFERGSVQKTIHCSLRSRRFREIGLDKERKIEAKEHQGMMSFRLTGLLHYAAEGLVFGLLPLD